MVVNSKAPVIKLPAAATEDDHLALLGILNSSSACFWMKQVFQSRTHASQRHHPDPARAVYEFAATGLQSFPIPEVGDLRAAIVELSRLLDERARRRALLLDSGFAAEAIRSSESAADLLAKLEDRWRKCDEVREQMVALQEELDWTAYVAFGLAPKNGLVSSERYKELTCPRGSRPFERLRGRSSTVRAGGRRLSLEEGEVPSDGSLPIWADETWKRREGEISSSDELQLVETPVFKRAWRDTEQNIAEADYRRRKNDTDLRAWLADYVERWASTRDAPFNPGQMVAALQDDRSVLVVAEVVSQRPDFSLDTLLFDVLISDALPQHRFHVYTESGLTKRAVWQDVWARQRRQDADDTVGGIPVPPEYSQGSRGKSTDFLRSEYWQLRGKLDVPKERFIAFTEVPGRAGVETLYGWAGWKPLQRVKAILVIDEGLEDAGAPLADRAALLDSAWRLLPDVVREDASSATRLKAELQAVVGSDGPSRELLEDWRRRFPSPNTRGTRARRSPVQQEDVGDPEEAEAL